MQKIPTVFRRNPDDMKHVLDEVNPGCEWVLAGEGVPTRKYDGTCVMLDDRGWWARREVKPGKATPDNYRPVETDEVTGKTVGWEPVDQSAYAKAFRDAFENDPRYEGLRGGYGHGTYELVGPKVNGNPDDYARNTLVPHADAELLDLSDDGPGPYTADEVRQMVEHVGREGWEGIVWHHPDGRMAKLKVRDYQ
jgi:hypothetical protein